MNTTITIAMSMTITMRDEFGWDKEGLEDMAIKYVNKTCDAHALAMLAACYLPGVIAAYTQLAR